MFKRCGSNWGSESLSLYLLPRKLYPHSLLQVMVSLWLELLELVGWTLHYRHPQNHCWARSFLGLIRWLRVPLFVSEILVLLPSLKTGNRRCIRYLCNDLGSCCKAELVKREGEEVGHSPLLCQHSVQICWKSQLCSHRDPNQEEKVNQGLELKLTTPRSLYL